MLLVTLPTCGSTTVDAGVGSPILDTFWWGSTSGTVSGRRIGLTKKFGLSAFVTVALAALRTVTETSRAISVMPPNDGLGTFQSLALLLSFGFEIDATVSTDASDLSDVLDVSDATVATGVSDATVATEIDIWSSGAAGRNLLGRELKIGDRWLSRTRFWREAFESVEMDMSEPEKLPLSSANVFGVLAVNRGFLFVTNASFWVAIWGSAAGPLDTWTLLEWLRRSLTNGSEFKTSIVLISWSAGI